MPMEKKLEVKKHIRFETPHVVAVPFIYGVECNVWRDPAGITSCFLTAPMWLASSHLQFQPFSIRLKYLKTFFFWPGDLDLWPLTLTFEHDLDILPLDLHTKIQVCMSDRSSRRVVTDTHRHTHRHTMSKLLHPSLTQGVKIARWQGIVGGNCAFIRSRHSLHFSVKNRIPFP